MARTKKKHRRRGGFKVSIAIVAGLLPGVSRLLYHTQAGGIQGLSTEAARIYTGYDPASGRWIPSLMWYGFLPLTLGVVIHKVASKLGINRALGQAGIPFIRV